MHTYNYSKIPLFLYVKIAIISHIMNWNKVNIDDFRNNAYILCSLAVTQIASIRILRYWSHKNYFYYWFGLEIWRRICLDTVLILFLCRIHNKDVINIVNRKFLGTPEQRHKLKKKTHELANEKKNSLSEMKRWSRIYAQILYTGRHRY